MLMARPNSVRQRVVREHLHVAGENHNVGTLLVDEFEQSLLGARSRGVGGVLGAVVTGLPIRRGRKVGRTAGPRTRTGSTSPE